MAIFKGIGMKATITSILFLMFGVSNLYGQTNPKEAEQTTADNISHTYLNSNNISTIFYNDGRSDILPDGNSGFEYPKGSGKTALFQSGFLWAGFVGDESIPRLGGSIYRSGLQPGKILPDGNPEDPDLSKNRIYRVRSDVYPGGPTVELISEIADENDTYQNIRDQYITDWNEWPADDGAPFIDNNGNGIYEPAIDFPGIENAKQTIWYVANDMNPGITFFFSESNPMGIELQVTIWLYTADSATKNMFFKKYKLINKNKVDKEFRDMYIASWSDMDIGFYADNFIGTDVQRNMIYGYNSIEYDQIYHPLPTPAVGFKLMQGPILVSNLGEDKNKNGVDDANDFAILDNTLKGPGFINLPMTASYFYLTPSDAAFNSPRFDYDYTSQWYNFIQGKIGISGDPYIDPITNQTTKFPFSGNPVAQTGWLDGILLPAGYRRGGFASGPFNMAVGDTQEVVIAQIAALGSDRFKSINLLRYYATKIQREYNNFTVPQKLAAPPSPEVIVKNTIDGILLEWDENQELISEIENFNKDGYAFQGYNIYWSTVPKLGFEFDTRIASFDLVDGIKTIYGEIIDPETGYPINGIRQQGNDTGIKRSILIDQDYSDGSNLIKGKEYLFSVSAYTYQNNPPNKINTTESELAYISISYLDTLDGANYGDSLFYSQSAGSGDDVDFNITVVDPSKLTGDEYEIFFTIKNYFRGEDGEWYQFGKVGDLTGSRLYAIAKYGEQANTVELEFELENNSHNGAWIDGIITTFPPGINILSAPEFEARGGTVIPEVNGQQITMGLVNNEYTQNGIFHGTEKWKVIVQTFTPPIEIAYSLKDDGWENDPIDIIDTLIVESIEFETKTEKTWNLRNISTNNTLLLDQTVKGNKDIYTNEVVGFPVVDGLELDIQVHFEMPTTFSALKLNGTKINRNSSTSRFKISDYTDFGIPIAITQNAQLGFGTNDSSLFVKDYELRFNGVTKIDSSNGLVYEHIISGGQLATLYGARIFDIAYHPLNPNPGSSEPFLIRVPFEVWSIDDNKQINFMVYDRVGSLTETDTFQVWNKVGRMYTAFVMSDYHENVIQPESEEAQNYATWNLVWWGNDWQAGDVLQVFYPSPITPADKFTFTAPQPFNKEDFRIPESYDLLQNYPNPFNPTTTIRFNLPEPNLTKMEIFNILGQKITTLVNSFYKAGIHEVQFSSSGLASGVYFYRIESGGFTDVKKMLLLK